MAYPARNFEKDPSKRTKGWYMVPGKGRRYWDGKTFKYRSPDGTTNVKDMVGDRLKGLVKRISKGSEKGRAINARRRGRNRGRGAAVQSEGKSSAPNPESKSGQNNPTTQQKPEVKKPPVTKPEVKKPDTSKASTPKKTAYQAARDKIKTAKDKKGATLAADIQGLKSFIKAHGDKPGMAKAVAKAKASLERKKEQKKPKSAAVKKGWPGNKNY